MRIFQFCIILLGTFVINSTNAQNVTDATNMKQGYWQVNNTIKKLPNYSADQLVEEGSYKDNRKTGVWKMYYPSNKLKSEITYDNGKPKGYAKFYFENGNVSEEGIWEGNKWTGEYKMYYENGQLFYDWKYTGEGKREGDQKYYHDNGYVLMEGKWTEGKENGELKEYHYSGALKEVRNYNGGKMDEASVKKFEDSGKADPNNNRNVTSKQAVVLTEEKPKEEVKIAEEVKPAEPEAPKAATLVENGYNKLFNKNKQLEQEGEFKNYRLWEGKKFEYESDKLTKVITVKEGKVVKVENK